METNDLTISNSIMFPLSSAKIGNPGHGQLGNSWALQAIEMDMENYRRKFVFSMFRIIGDIQKAKYSGDKEDAHLHCSKNARRILETLMDDIGVLSAKILSRARDANDPPEEEILLPIWNVFDLLKFMESTWHVCEIFYLNKRETLDSMDDNVNLQFCNWLQRQVCFSYFVSSMHTKTWTFSLHNRV